MLRETTLPADALLRAYARGYTDAFTLPLVRTVTLWDYVEAFYATPLFRTEKALLRTSLIFKRPNWDATRLRAGEPSFAAWTVEGQTDTQLLMCDLAGATRSWFAVAQEPAGTRLYFGSAVLPNDNGTLPLLARALMPFHRTYSRALLSAAARRLG